MSRPVNITSAVTVNIASFSGITGSVSSGNTNPPSYGVNSSANTTSHAVFSGTSNSSSGYVYYNFDTISIPSNATINSVSCVARGRVSSTYGCYAAFQLYAGSTPKGSATNFNTTEVSACTLTTGTWAASDFQDPKLCITVRRASRWLTGSAHFYGATLTVNYSVNGTEYEISFNNQSSDVTTVPSETQYVAEGGSQGIVFNEISDLADVAIEDNGTDISSSLVAGGTGSYTYTISNIQADHTISINDVGGTFYTVNATSNYTGATVSPTTKQIREVRSHTITITAQNAYEFRVLDNGADVTSSVVSDGSNFTYTVSNVTAEHNIVINEAEKYLVTASSRYAGTTISPASSYVYSGQSITLTISGFSAKNRVKDNGTDITSSLVQSGSNYLYTISNVSQAHEVVVYYEGNFIKVNGTFKQVLKYYKKVDGGWTEITPSGFSSEIEDKILVYGGQQTGSTVIGEVVKSGSTVEILINDNALQTGTYKFVYEDESKTPLGNVDEIKEFTIS